MLTQDCDGISNQSVTPPECHACFKMNSAREFGDQPKIKKFLISAVTTACAKLRVNKIQKYLTNFKWQHTWILKSPTYFNIAGHSLALFLQTNEVFVALGWSVFNSTQHWKGWLLGELKCQRVAQWNSKVLIHWPQRTWKESGSFCQPAAAFTIMSVPSVYI